MTLPESPIPVPDDLILVARVSGASGLRGALKLNPENAPNASVLLSCRQWWLGRPRAQPSAFRVLGARAQGGAIVAQLEGLADRDAALRLKGSEVSISRAAFPATASDEYYWVDLIGCAVVNAQAQDLGVVADMMDHGAHPILSISPSPLARASESDDPLLIPFVESFIVRVDIRARRIEVDWPLEPARADGASGKTAPAPDDAL